MKSDNRQSKFQNLKSLGLVAIGVTFAMLGFVAEAQQQAKVFKIGWLGTRPGTGEVIAGRGSGIIRRMLRELGYVEGKNLVFEFRSADNNLDRLPALADELIRLKVDLILVGSTSAAQAARNATKTIVTSPQPINSECDKLSSAR